MTAVAFFVLNYVTLNVVVIIFIVPDVGKLTHLDGKVSFVQNVVLLGYSINHLKSEQEWAVLCIVTLIISILKLGK